VRMEVGAGTSMSPYDTGTTLVEICPRIEAYQNSYQLPLNQVQFNGLHLFSLQI
jgi:hypothetical protein